tara:strand:+ start:1145 stop:1381 length:237 start_codon:yes stop_codon:yes gene_type:complete
MYKNLFRADTLIIKRALKQYVKNISIYSDDYHSIKRIIKELNEPSKDAEIHAEVVDFMLKELMKKYSFIDKKGNIVKY